LAEQWVKTIEHESLYFEYWVAFILYVLANNNFNFEFDIIYGTPSVHGIKSQKTLIFIPSAFNA
jgi:hypothetical protein